AFLPLAGRSIASWGLNTLGSVEGVGLLVFVVRPEDLEHARFVAGRETDHRLEIITGGDTRQESELLALRHLADRMDPGAVDTVLIHDAARPLVCHGLAAAVLHAAREAGERCRASRPTTSRPWVTGSCWRPGASTRGSWCGCRPPRASARRRSWMP